MFGRNVSDDDSANENVLQMNRIRALVIVINFAVHSLCKMTFGSTVHMIGLKASAMLILFWYAHVLCVSKFCNIDCQVW